MFVAVAPVEVEWPQRFEIVKASRTNDKINYDDLLRTVSAGLRSPDLTRFKMSSIANNLAERFGTKGSPISLSTACASGATSIQLGVEAIRRGESDAALCIGTDGFVMAEGAAAVVLENLQSAKARGAKILGVIEGCGEMADSFHRTRSSPDGKPIIGCIRNALADAGLGPEDIDYINPHGTGTPENDKMECLGVMAVFGERAKSVPISSNKSMIGHTLSAAGTVEAVFTLMTLQNQRLPPTINYQVPDPTIPLDVVPNKARDAILRHAISNSFGFGGQNVSLVIGREPA